MKNFSYLMIDTHGHAHLLRESQNIYRLPNTNRIDSVISLTCAVEPGDWPACLEFASSSERRRAALGVHPWYLSSLESTATFTQPVDNDGEDNTEPIWLQEREKLLQQHPGCMVGEIGLCKMARFVRTYPAGKQAALDWQRTIFEQQLRLAAKYDRPASIHCVDQQGVLLKILQQLGQEGEQALPPTMALHSFSGTAHHVQQLLRWEESLETTSNKTPVPRLYFGFSHAVNFSMCSSEKSRRQNREAIRAVPDDRILVESDVHHENDVVAATAGAVAYVTWAREESILNVAQQTRLNGWRFLHSLAFGTVSEVEGWSQRITCLKMFLTSL